MQLLHNQTDPSLISLPFPFPHISIFVIITITIILTQNIANLFAKKYVNTYTLEKEKQFALLAD